MCKLCDGTNVVQSESSFAVGFHPCPNCGPLPVVKQREQMDLLQKRLDEFEEKFINLAS